MAPPSGKSTKANDEGLDEIVELYKDRDPTNLIWFYAVGRLLKQLERRDSGLYGKRFIRAAANRLQGTQGTLSIESLVGELTAAKQFVRQFPTRAEVKTIVARVRRQRMKFGVTHARYLLTIADREKRRRFIEQCLEQRWTGKQLRAEIKQDRGDGKRPGRPIRAPTTRLEALHALLEGSEAWLKRFESLRPVIDEADRAEKPEFVAKLLSDAQRRLQQMATAIDLALPKLRAAPRRAKKATQKGRQPKRTKPPTLEALENMGSSFWK